MEGPNSRSVSDSASDRTVIQIQHAKPIDVTGNESAAEDITQKQDRNAYANNVNQKSLITTGPDLLAISIEVVVITLLNRARVLLMLRDRTGARQCFEQALHCSKSSSNLKLQQKCSEWMETLKTLQSDRRHSRQRGLSSKVVQQTASNPTTPMGVGSGASDLYDMLDAMTRGVEIPESVLREVAARSSLTQPLPSASAAQADFPPSAFHNRKSVRVSGIANRPTSMLMPDSALRVSYHELETMPTDMDRFYATIRDAPARSRVELDAMMTASSSTPSKGVTASTLRPDKKIKLDTPDDRRKFHESTLMIRRRLGQRPSTQAQQSTQTPTHERPRSFSVDQNATPLKPQSQRRPSSGSDQSASAENDLNETPYSPDIPSLSKLAETMSLKPELGSDTSVVTAIRRRTSLSTSHSPPSLTVQTSGPMSSTASLTHSTTPLHHSPLREAFVPESDSMGHDDRASASSTVSFTDPFASDKIVGEAGSSGLHHPDQSQDTLIAPDQVDDSNLSRNKDDFASSSPAVPDPNEVISDEELEDKVQAILDNRVSLRAANRLSQAPAKIQREQETTVAEAATQGQPQEQPHIPPSESQLAFFGIRLPQVVVKPEAEEHNTAVLQENENPALATPPKSKYLNPQFQQRRQQIERRLNGSDSSSSSSRIPIPILSPKASPKALQNPPTKTRQHTSPKTRQHLPGPNTSQPTKLSSTPSSPETLLQGLRNRHIQEAIPLLPHPPSPSLSPNTIAKLAYAAEPRAYNTMMERHEREIKSFKTNNAIPLSPRRPKPVFSTMIPQTRLELEQKHSDERELMRKWQAWEIVNVERLYGPLMPWSAVKEGNQVRDLEGMVERQRGEVEDFERGKGKDVEGGMDKGNEKE